MTEEKPKRQRRHRNPRATTRLSDEQLAFMNWLFPGFRAEYEATHDAEGKPTTLIPGLKYIGDERQERVILSIKQESQHGQHSHQS